MIFELKKWCEGIIVAVIICIIIEALIPENNNKKYIKVVIGIYIMNSIFGTMISVINKDFSIKELWADIEYIETSSSRDFDDMKDIYILGIENDIKNELIEKGYEVNNVKVLVDNKYENIEKIEIDFNQEKQNLKTNSEIINFLIENYAMENIVEEQIIFK